MNKKTYIVSVQNLKNPEDFLAPTNILPQFIPKFYKMVKEENTPKIRVISHPKPTNKKIRVTEITVTTDAEIVRLWIERG